MQQISNADLSVVIISHRHAEIVGPCLELLHAARGDGRMEAVVVNNTRDDPVVPPPHAPARVIVNDREVGFAANANTGVRATRAPYVALVNPDVRMTGGTLAAGVEFLARHPGVGCMGALLLNPDGSRQPSARRFPTLRLLLMRGLGGDRWGRDLAYYRTSMEAGLATDAPARVDWVTGAFMMFPRAAFEAVGGFDPRYRLYYEDVDFCRRLGEAGYATVLNPALSAVHAHARESAAGPFRKVFYWHLASAARFLSSGHRSAGARPAPAAGALPSGAPHGRFERQTI